MLTRYSTVFTLIFSVIFFISELQVETAPSNTINENYVYPDDNYIYSVVYRRFIRRRPPIHLADRYMEEIVEIFDTKEKPPAYGALMTDYDVDQFIFCDFNAHLEKCKQYWKSISQVNHFLKKPTTPQTTVINHSSTKTTTNTIETTTGNSKIPDLNEAEYIYSDEIQEMEKPQQEDTKDEDYYEEEIDY